MSVVEMIAQTVKALPEEKAREVLSFAENLAREEAAEDQLDIEEADAALDQCDHGISWKTLKSDLDALHGFDPSQG
jgi:hypothetical protein